MSKLFIGASLLASFVFSPSFAQSSVSGANLGAAQTPDQGDVIVTAPVPQSERDILQGTSILTGDELARELRPTIGDTLSRQAGVSATSFGPSASRPVLRGLQGERIRVLTDGIGAIDVSNTSVDHAVVIDPLLAERVEVLRGPSALLFGSSAVGGVVNVIDTRIPRRRPAGGGRVAAIANYGSAADQRSAGAAGDVAIGRHLVLHADGSYLKTDDLRTGGFILSRDARARALSSAMLPSDASSTDEEPIDFAANAALRGRLPNSATETWTAGVGASIVTDTGHLGVSYSRYDSLYGIPLRYATAPGQAQEAPRLDIVQDRVDLRADVETGGGVFDRVRLRVGHAKYRHFELEDTGEIATTFRNNGVEGRFEIVQSNRGGWQGASGVQYFNRQFDVAGEEAFLPRNGTEQVGLFTVQQFDLGRVKVEGGVRYEITDLVAQTTAEDARFFGGRRRFDAVSGSLGASMAVAEDVRVGLNASRTERAPSAEELFANGGHAGTQAYELGNPEFALETSWGLEATLHAHGDGFSLDAAAFYNKFDDYISEDQVDQAVCEAAAAPSGREVDLPCFQYRQADANYYGVEAELSARLGRIGGFAINADLLGDYVRATVRNRGPVPRIPPLRLLAGIEAQGDRLNARVEVEHVFAQDRIAAFESATGAYTILTPTISFHPFGRDNRTSVLVSAHNILDVTARRHASFLKDFAPLAGRDIRATLRVGL